MQSRSSNRIVLPTADESGVYSWLAKHFGRAPYLTVVDLDKSGEVSDVRVMPNLSRHFGGTRHTQESILELEPDAVIVSGMGARGMNVLQNAGAAVLRTDNKKVREAILAYTAGELQELAEGCCCALCHIRNRDKLSCPREHETKNDLTR